MLSKISIKRPVTTIMIIMMTFLAGLISYSTLKLDLMPTIDVPIALVATTYVGAGPEEIETLVTKPIEGALGSVSNVKTITSTSSSNSSMVMIQFVDGTDIDMAAIDMREKIDLMKSSLPEDAQEPMVLKMDMNQMSSIVVGISGKNMTIPDLTDLLDEGIITSIEKIDGVSSVDKIGTRENVVNITLDSQKMAGYGISTSQISNMLSAENINLPIGNLKEGDLNVLVRTMGEFKSIDDIKNIIITTAGGSTVRLSDFADVEETVADEDSYAIVNGQKSVALQINKQSTANVVDISNKVVKQLDKIASNYPQLEISMLSNTSDYIQESVNNVLSTALQAAFMAVIVIFLFLRSARTSAIIAVSIPTSVVATFAMMYVAGMTLNIISLGGITIGIGMLVDNSIVVLENIFKHHDRGEDAKTAAEMGAKEVAMPVMASTLTTVAVFIPLMFVKGSIGQMFKDLSLTVTFALLASLIVSLTFVPMASSQLLVHDDTKGRKSRGAIDKVLNKWGEVLDKLDAKYRSVLEWCLIRKKRVVLITFVAFLASSVLIPLTGFELMPTMDQGSASVTIEMPKGSILDETSKIVDQVVEEIEKIEEVDVYYVLLGGGGMMGGGTDAATISMNMVGKKERSRTTEEICDALKEEIKNIPGADITVAASSSAMGSYSSGSDIQFQLNCDDSDLLKQSGKEIVKLLSEQKWVKDVTSSEEEGAPEARVIINRDKAAKYGVTTSSVAGALNSAISGSTATQYKVNGTEVDVIIKEESDRIDYLKDLQKITITSPKGVIIPITEVVDITTGEAATTINRKDQHKYATIQLNLVDMDAGTAQGEIIKLLDVYQFPEGVSYQFTGDVETMVETFTSLLLVLVVAVLLVYMIMASQFESFIYPFIVMFSVPLAITGGVLGLFITRNRITATSFMGFIMLVGMVVNNAIVLIDYANQLREKGMECNEALIQAGPDRLRPILMTTLTTVIGMVPMALAMGEGTEMQAPMGIAIIFGLSLSTLVTLVFIPVLYSSVEVLRLRQIQKKNDARKEKRQIKKLEKKEQKKPKVIEETIEKTEEKIDDDIN